MKVVSYIEPKSSFLSLEKDLAIIVDKILADTRLKKLLYYPSKDALTKQVRCSPIVRPFKKDGA